MNKRIQRLWTATLRSGEYKQAKGALKVGDGYCCLGVLCDLAAKEGVGKWRDNAYVSRDGSGVEREMLNILPDAVVQWSGLEYSYGFSLGDVPNSAHTLPHLNDQRGFTFSQIADEIDSKFPETSPV